MEPEFCFHFAASLGTYRCPYLQANSKSTPGCMQMIHPQYLPEPLHYAIIPPYSLRNEFHETTKSPLYSQLLQKPYLPSDERDDLDFGDRFPQFALILDAKLSQQPITLELNFCLRNSNLLNLEARILHPMLNPLVFARFFLSLLHHQHILVFLCASFDRIPSIFPPLFHFLLGKSIKRDRACPGWA